jgi:hypothetical protein
MIFQSSIQWNPTIGFVAVDKGLCDPNGDRSGPSVDSYLISMSWAKQFTS